MDACIACFWNVHIFQIPSTNETFWWKESTLNWKHFVNRKDMSFRYVINGYSYLGYRCVCTYCRELLKPEIKWKWFRKILRFEWASIWWCYFYEGERRYMFTLKRSREGEGGGFHEVKGLTLSGGCPSLKYHWAGPCVVLCVFGNLFSLFDTS